METIQCKGCGEIKDSNEFYFADGGLEINGIAEIKCELCKDCVKYYNDNNRKRVVSDSYKYLYWQRISCYFAAKFDKTASFIENGMPKISKADAIKNFKYLFGKPNGLSHTSKQQEKVFDMLCNRSKTNLKSVVKEILENDYETFRKFKENAKIR